MSDEKEITTTANAENDKQPLPIDEPEQEAELSPEEQAKLRLMDAIANAVREAGKARSYMTLSELCAQLEMERNDVRTLMDELKAQEAYQDICVYKGAKDLYYYTYPLLAHNYVKNVALAQEDDLPRTIAEVVRYESKIYPRATAIDTFTKFPYHYTPIQIQRMLERMARQEEYQDIQIYESGKKKLYVFSTLHLSRAYASTLVEMSEDTRMWL